MPISDRKKLMWDKAKGRGGWSGRDETWAGEDVNDHIEKCLLLSRSYESYLGKAQKWFSCMTKELDT